MNPTLLLAISSITLFAYTDAQLGRSCHIPGKSCGVDHAYCGSPQPKPKIQQRQKRWACVFCGDKELDEQGNIVGERQRPEPQISGPLIRPVQPEPPSPPPAEPVEAVQPPSVDLIDTSRELLSASITPVQRQQESSGSASVSGAQLIKTEPWNSDVSIDELAEHYLEEEASQLPSGESEMTIDEGRSSVVPRVSEETNTDTQFFDTRIDKFRTVPVTIRKNMHTYETNKRILNNIVNKVNRFNIHNHIVSEQNEIVNNIHHPLEIREQVNVVRQKLEPKVYNHIYQVENRQEFNTVEPEKDQFSQRDVTEEIQKTPVEVYRIMESGEPPKQNQLQSRASQSNQNQQQPLFRGARSADTMSTNLKCVCMPGYRQSGRRCIRKVNFLF